MSFKLSPPTEVATELGKRSRARRLAQNWTQKGLSERSGVPVPTLRKFEKTGQISLVSFIRLTLALGDDTGLDGLLQERQRPSSLDDVLASETKPKRGRRN